MSENGTELPIHDVRLYGEYWGQSGPAAGVAKSTQMTQMYGPAVRRKRFSSIWRMRSCINVSGLRLERIWLRAIMDISARAISLADRPRTGHLGHQCSHAPGRPILHRCLILSQTSAGMLVTSSIVPHFAPFLFLGSCRAVVPSSRPARADAPRARAVKAGRRAVLPSCSTAARLRLDGPEHGARIRQVRTPSPPS